MKKSGLQETDSAARGQVYTTPPLAAGVEVTGEIVLALPDEGGAAILHCR